VTDTRGLDTAKVSWGFNINEISPKTLNPGFEEDAGRATSGINFSIEHLNFFFYFF